jgi:hypothetical protein
MLSSEHASVWLVERELVVNAEISDVGLHLYD